MTRRVILLVVLVALLTGSASECLAVGKYCLAFWRELGANENGGAGGGNHSMFFWVWDENGNPKANVKIYTTWDVLLGTTDADGRCEVVIDVANDHYECKCVDTLGSASDATPWMTSRRWPNWGHYSYEIGFMYKSDQSNPGTYDTSICGTVNTSTSYDTDAPCTKSLAYYSTNCLDWYSDSFTLSNWVDSHGQTFVANGDRITAVQVHGAIGGNTSLSWTAEILAGGPSGTRVAGPKSIPIRQPTLWLLPFGVNECPVTPGGTYYLKITRSGGLNTYTVGNNYASGCYYLNGVAQTTKDIQGLVLGMTYGSSQFGTLRGTVRSGGSGLADAIVTVNPGSYTQYTQPDGTYSFTSMPAGTYTVEVWKPGYSRVTQTGKVVNVGEITVADFSLNALTNLVTNPGFETGSTSGWTTFGNGFNAFSGWAVSAHGGTKYGGYVTSWGAGAGGVYQILNVTSGVEYTLSTYIWTDSWDGPERATEYPNNVRCRIGADPTGGTDPNSANVQWGDWSTSFIKWSPIWIRKTATSSKMTVFLRYTMDSPHEWNKACFDDVFVTREVAQPDIHITVGPTATGITANSATITWTTDVASDSRVDYGLTSGYGQYQYNASSVTSHSINLTGLSPGQTYHYKVTSSASGYNPASSTDLTFATTALPQINITSGPTAGSITQTSAVIAWTTDIASTSRVDYGPTSSYGLNQYDSSLVTNHSIPLSGLTPNTTYHYECTSTASGYADAISGDLTFITSPTPGTILNPGFESQEANWTRYGQFDDGGDNGIQSAGWYWGFNPHGGVYFAGSAASWDKKNGGFYQQVAAVPGTLHKFTSWIRTYHAGNGSNEDTTNRVGIDPTGGTDGASANVVWSPNTWSADWSLLGTAAVAQSQTVTVFLDATQRLACEWNLNAFDDTAMADVPAVSIAQAKSYADGTEVGLVGRAVTAGTSQMGGAFYVEEADRSSAIRVITGASVAEGDIVNVTGTLGTVNGERCLTATALSIRSSGNTIPGPLAMICSSLGGEDLNQYAKGATGSNGPNNVGLLAVTFGRVLSAGSGYCYITDRSRDQVKVDTSSVTNAPPAGQYVIIKGISRLEKVGSDYLPVIKPRKNADVSVVPG